MKGTKKFATLFSLCWYHTTICPFFLYLSYFSMCGISEM